MASTNCWRCLARPSQRVLSSVPTICSTSSPSALIPAAAASFTTSATQLANPKGPKDTGSGLSRHIRSGKRLVLGKKKKRQQTRDRPVAPGERKAFRKRIQLSNDNALEVEGLPELSPHNIADPDAVGQVVGLPGTLVDQLRASEAFKPTQNWGLFRSPHMLIRRETVDLVKRLEEAVEKKETARVVITGDRGSGKSILGLQALAAGFMNKWVVINIPEGQDLTTAHTEYAPIPNSEMFSQPVYTVKLMQAIHKANLPVLSQHKVEGDHMHLPISVTRNMTLAAMLSATREPEFAWPVFESFWRELLRPGRPPVLLALDGLHHVMRVSDYRSPSFERIHSHDLALVRIFADALGGRSAFPNGAAVVGVTSRGNCPVLPSVEKAIEQAAALQGQRQKQQQQQQQVGSDSVSVAEDVVPISIPPRDPFYRGYDERVFDVLRGVAVHGVHGVSKPEARALMEYWAASGILRQRVDEYNVSEKWTLAGGGVLAEMERVALYDNRVTM
ncbi:hypothetical protein DL767_000868 [Monosporascus sp. MG133]|nr:hypothetical protein DL767_000868 [Monosporascus sp. MG133]